MSSIHAKRRLSVMRILGALALIMVILLLLLPSGCANGMFYYPDRVDYGSPAQYGRKYENVTFTSGDGTKLHGWFLPAEGAARGTVIHFHGNAQNISSHVAFVEWLPAEGFNVFTFDYRGYGASEGKPKRRGTIEDGVAAIEYVKGRPDVNPQRLLVLGQSLGGAVAISTLGSHKFEGVRAVAIDSAFSSYRGAARDALSHAPIIGWFRWPIVFVAISGGYDPEDVVAKISPTPLLLVHGTADRVVASRHSERLFECAGVPKNLILLDGAQHTQAFTNPSQMRETLVEFYLKAME
jgi:fermentation-respiration switch protein FrsA (DUF1100 family)